MRRLSIALASLFLITGCSQQNTGNTASTTAAPAAAGGGDVLGSLRPKADPSVLAKIREEHPEGSSPDSKSDANTFVTSTAVTTASDSPIAPPADQASGPIVTPADGSQTAAGAAAPAADKPSWWPFGGGAASKAPEVASYGGYGGGAVPPPPPGGGGGLVPPPPAVSMSTSAQPLPYGAMDGYSNPYANPYAQQQQAPAAVQRPNLFGSGDHSSSSSDDSGSDKRKNANFVPITPTGMDARSAYKQKDDLKVLWKSALANSPVQALANRDERIAQQVSKLDVSLPPDASRGSINVTQRQIEQVFKPAALDRRIVDSVNKLQTDLVTSYYRYLYSFNNYAKAQQTVAARKQEVDFAGTPSERQRAAADLASAQSDADSAKDDMRAAQFELASAAGPDAARTIIMRVQGTAPSADALAQGAGAGAAAPARAAARAGLLGEMKSVLSFHHGEGKPEAAPADKSDKKVKKGKGGDQPAPQAVASASAPATAAAARPAAPPPSAASSAPIAFQLKGVNVTPRKSVISVSIRNNSDQSFSFSTDDVSVSEGNRRLSDATVRADFDSTVVAPNQEVTGTITMFGRPWTDRLSVCISEGGQNIQLRR